MIYARSQSDAEIGTRILSISDLHIPFQKPIEVFKEYCGRVDVLQLNGDITDCHSISKFPKTYRNSPMEEIVETRQYLIELIEMLRPREVVVNYGNHDIRFQNYLAKNLDTDLLELMPKTSLELIVVDGFHRYNKATHTKVWYQPLQEVFEDVKITYVDNWHCQIGGTIFCHPVAFSGGIMGTAEKARRYFKDSGHTFDSLVMAHTHRLGRYDVGDTIIYEQGAACETARQHYADGRLSTPPREGFIYVCQDKNGRIMAENTKLIKLN